MNEKVPLEQYQALEAKCNQLQHQLEQIKRLVFGAKSERFISTQIQNQLELDFGQLEKPNSAPIVKESITYEPNK